MQGSMEQGAGSRITGPTGLVILLSLAYGLIILITGPTGLVVLLYWPYEPYCTVILALRP